MEPAQNQSGRAPPTVMSHGAAAPLLATAHACACISVMLFLGGNRSVPIEQRSISMPVNVAKDPRIYNITVASAISRVRRLVGSFSLPDPYLSAGQCHILLRRKISLPITHSGEALDLHM